MTDRGKFVQSGAICMCVWNSYFREGKVYTESLDRVYKGLFPTPQSVVVTLHTVRLNNKK